ncbi:hypothetical protein AXG93_3828s1020 [Marchantia polymorpha subsp. ruderalis]|uniref:Uncharacterized protein n=1 Tax=Marchantia polymorpha subsp. ruderalis TaxID=1480154 RepID=A0A176VH73_MARPO|nr:hypothetical protein AXG93_3828s1020 [Marchantia polymorpha subsp. ruderalis]
MITLRVSQIKLRAFQDKLHEVRLDFLLWGWNWMNPRKFMKDVEVDTDPDEVPVISSPGRPRVEEERRGVNELPSAEPEWEDLARPTRVGFPTPLEMLAAHGVEATAEEAARPSARESPRISAAIEIVESEEKTPSEEEEV